MSTAVFRLRCLVFDMAIGNNEDWRDSWTWSLPGLHLPLAGIDFDFTVQSLTTGAIVVAASTGRSVGALPLNGRVAVGGADGDVLGLNIPRAAMLRILAAEGGYVAVISASDPATTMLGQYVSYDPGSATLTLLVTSYTGAAARADWTILPVPPPFVPSGIDGGYAGDPSPPSGATIVTSGPAASTYSGVDGAGGGLYSGEWFHNFVDGFVYLGIGSSGGTPDMATSYVAVPYASIMDLVSAQTISGAKTFSASPAVPTPPVGDTSTKAVTAAFVAAAILSAVYNRDSKESVRAASTSNVTLSGPGATVGGVAMNAGDRFSALAQTTNTEPGIYIWNGASAAATRAPDAVQGEVTSGEFFCVEEGTFAGQGFELITANPITLGTTALTARYEGCRVPWPTRGP